MTEQDRLQHNRQAKLIDAFAVIGLADASTGSSTCLGQATRALKTIYGEAGFQGCGQHHCYVPSVLQYLPANKTTAELLPAQFALVRFIVLLKSHTQLSALPVLCLGPFVTPQGGGGGECFTAHGKDLSEMSLMALAMVTA
jgi:hypothetical protein